jgi:DNA repair exonuclease SbcCD ATPase subunit
MTIETVARKHLILKDRLGDMRMRYESLALSVGQAKTRVEIEPEVMGVMEELQRREHERAVGAYEELLTLFMRDVLPGHRDVVMDLRTERSLPALDVYLRKGEGMPLEDALSGTGGSVTNILSAGLRFISLVRSGRRPFLVLDEPDCWIKPELAPKFAAVVQSVAEQLGVQVLMISHHDEQMFETLLPHRLRLEKNGSQLMAHWAPTASQPEWTEGQSGLRSIELINFQSHAHTIIPLSPGLTLINGDNDIGKSAIVSALRSVFDADSNENHIRHGAKSAKVLLDFGDDHVLSWERFRKGNPTVVYELRPAGSSHELEPIHRSLGARDVPEWVQDFGIGLIDGIDVQLANQKEPVFLLSKPARDRAKALAIGGENAHVQEMLAIGKQEINEARLIVRNGEKELEKLHRARQTLEVIDTRDEAIISLEEKSKRLEQQQQEHDKMGALLGRWLTARARHGALQPMLGEMPQPPLVPTNYAQADRILADWSRAQKRISALVPLDAVDFDIQPPVIQPADAEMLLARWGRARKTVQALHSLSNQSLPALPTITPTDQGEGLVKRWSRARATLNVLDAAPQQPLPTVPSIDDRENIKIEHIVARWNKALISQATEQREINAIESQTISLEKQMNELGASCPECGQPLPGHDHSLRP